MLEIGGYQIMGQIAQGGMATVYLAKHPERVEWVALKVLSAHAQGETEFVARFEREGQVITALNHPHIVPVYAVGVDNGRQYIAMAYLNYGSLRDRLDRFANHGEQMSVLEALEVGRQIARALDFAHKSGLVHRDVKPNNILLAPGGRYVLSDFGTVLMQGRTRLTRDPQHLIGTAEYMSPEQAENKQVDLRADIYALGVVLYELFAGHVPFSNDTDMLVLFAHVNQLPKPIGELRPDIPPIVQWIVERMLCKNPNDRFETAAAAALAIEQAMTHIAEPQTKERVTGSVRYAITLLILFALITLIRIGNSDVPALFHEDSNDTRTTIAPTFNPVSIVIAKVTLVTQEPNGAILRRPSLSAGVMQSVSVGMHLLVLGRTSDGIWLQVMFRSEVGWVPRTIGDIDGRLDNIPQVPIQTEH